MNSIDLWQKKLSPILSPFGQAYSAIMRTRAWMYGHGLFRSWTAPVPTISVGNIRWGGTGKTPLCSWILSWFIEQGLKPVVLTRGYKASPPALPWLVTADSSFEQSGDEPLLLASSHLRASVLVDPCRKRSGTWAVNNLHPDIILLDDGFQHLAIHRHIDLVVLSAHDLAEGWNNVIPAGAWREDCSALKRASAFLINVPSPTVDPALLDQAHTRLKSYHRPIFFFNLEPDALTDLHGQNHQTSLCNAPYLLVTGVANPERVLAGSTKFLGYPPLRHFIFPDHHAYATQDIQRVINATKGLDCAHILCTPKDAVKLKNVDHPGWLSFQLKFSFLKPDSQTQSFPHWLQSSLDDIKKLGPTADS